MAAAAAGGAEAAQAMLEERLPMVAACVPSRALEGLAARPPSRLPVFQWCGPRLHLRRQAVLLGDAIHSVKPYFGMGVNSALEDVVVLGRCLAAAGVARPGARPPAAASCPPFASAERLSGLEAALERFSAERGPEAAALVEVSHGLDYPGLRGFVNFIGPIILDNIFARLLPSVFLPSTTTSLQTPGRSFTQVRLRKRLDRTAQLTLLLAVAAATGELLVVGTRGLLATVAAVGG